MPTLAETLGAGEKRRRVVDDACAVLDQEVVDREDAVLYERDGLLDHVLEFADVARERVAV